MEFYIYKITEGVFTSVRKHVYKYFNMPTDSACFAAVCLAYAFI